VSTFALTRYSIHFGCAQARASRRMWCLAARGSGLKSRTSRTANTMSRSSGVPGHTRSETVAVGQRERPGSLWESGPLLAELGRCAVRLGASLSRIDLILIPIKRLSAKRLAGVHRCARQRHLDHRRSAAAHARTQTRQGSVVGDDEAGFHDEAFEEVVLA